MNWLDVVLVLIVAASVVASFRKGLSREIVGLVSVILALIIGIWFYGSVAGYLSSYLSSRALADFAGFALVFCAVLLVGSGVSFLVGKFLKVTGLSIVDHALGAGFGVIRGILISIAFVMALMAFSPGDKPPEAVVNSRTAPYVVDAARVVSALAPHELKEGFRKTYGQVKSAWAKTVKQGMLDVPQAEKAEDEGQI
ncbi:MAG TPA: CvpA family protein [Bryobacteraceae bacterium]|nr:CvpA family protein [Bryobacteraceae bacterium]